MKLPSNLETRFRTSEDEPTLGLDDPIPHESYRNTVSNLQFRKNMIKEPVISSKQLVENGDLFKLKLKQLKMK